MSNATLKTHNQTPRKVRLVTELVKGKKIPAALAALQFLPKRAANPSRNLLKVPWRAQKSRGKIPMI